jgi:hypothetical protein
MNKMSGRNFVNRFFFVNIFPLAEKPSKMVIAPEGRHMGPYPFGLFLVSLGPTYGQNTLLIALDTSLLSSKVVCLFIYMFSLFSN